MFINNTLNRSLLYNSFFTYFKTITPNPLLHLQPFISLPNHTLVTYPDPNLLLINFPLLPPHTHIHLMYMCTPQSARASIKQMRYAVYRIIATHVLPRPRYRLLAAYTGGALSQRALLLARKGFFTAPSE